MPSIAALGSIFFLLLAISLPNTASATAESDLYRCQAKVDLEGERLIGGHVRAIDTCLRKISVELIRSADTSRAAKLCVAQFRKILDGRFAGVSLRSSWRKVDAACDLWDPEQAFQRCSSR